MADMDEFFAQLENFEDLELSILKSTKIHKVLKAILKLPSIPKEEEYKFMERSNRLLQGWNKVLVGDEAGDGAEEPEKAEPVNGEKAETAKGKENGEKDSGEKDSGEKDASEADVAMEDAKEGAEAEEAKKDDGAEGEAVAA